MNFLNRQMFQDGGGANQEYVIRTDKSIGYYDPATFEQQLRSLSESEIFALQNSANSGQISFTPGLQSILNQVVNRKQIPAFEDDLSLDTTYSSPLLNRDPVQNTQSYKSIAGDYGRIAKGIYGPVLSSLVRNVMPKEALDDSTSFGIPGIGGASLKSIAEYDSPFFGEGVQGFEEAGARGGRTREELDAILSESLQTIPGQQIQDFQGDIDGFVGPAQPGVDVVDQAIVTESSGVTPRFESETLSLEGGPFDMETRRLEYQQEMIGRDEFGNLLPEGRLEQDDEISQLLEDIKPAEQKVDVDKTQADTLAEIDNKFGGLSQDEFRDELDKDLLPTMPSISGIPELQGQETLTKQGDPISRKLEQPGFFGSNRFLDFIRNVGGELTRTGDIAQGLGFGAAKAAEERTARELIEGQEERDYRMKLRLAKAEADLELRNLGVEGASDSMKKELRTVAQEVNADYNDIVSAKNTLEIVGQVEDIIMNKDTTSVKAITGEIFEKVGAFFNIDGEPEKSGKKWEDLEPRTRVKVLLNQIKQKNIRDILGESGKTISNLDRQIVDELVGSLKIGTTPQETLKALEMTKTSIFNNLSTSQNRLKTNFYFAEAEGGMYLIQDNSNIMQYLQTGNLPSRLYTSRYNDNSALKKITLEG